MRARIKPQLSKSQYSEGKTLLTGFTLTTEGGKVLHFSTRPEAEAHAKAAGYILYGSRLRVQ